MPIINMVYKKKKGWKPGANTIAYYPLTSADTTSDKSGNGYNLLTTHTSPSFEIYQGVDCAKFNGSNMELHNNSINQAIGSQFTLSLYIYATNNSSAVNNQYYNGTYYNWRISADSYSSYYWCFKIGDIKSTYKSNEGWVNLIFTHDGTTVKAYTNGTFSSQGTDLLGQNTNGMFTIGCEHNENNNYWSGWFNGGISNVILENKVRTAEEIQAYYNQTKANYGL